MFDYKKIAIDTITQELKGINALKDNLPNDFIKAAEAIVNCKGRVIVGGVGKSGYISKKIAASFASTGTPAFNIHPTEASHGDLGMINENDIVILLSNSGATKELGDVINYCKRFSIPIIGITMRIDSMLAVNSTYLLNIPKAEEASNVNAPTTSSTMMLVLGDALFVAVHEAKGFTKDDYKIYHPGGKLGASMLKISELMHSGVELPIVYTETLMSEVILTITSKKFGCTAVLDDKEMLIGIITDGDLRRHIDGNIFSLKANEVLTSQPVTINPNILAAEALGIMQKKKISSLLVAEGGKLVGIIHIHDLLRAGVI